MLDPTGILVVAAVAVVGAAVVYAGKELWSGVLEGKREFEAQRRSQSKPGAGPNFARDEEPEQADRDTAGPRDDKQRKQWHEILGVPPTAGLGEIKVAYRQQIVRYHPDRVANLGDELRELAEIRAKEINEAYALACKLRGA